MHRRWSRVFAVASVVTPIMLGVCVGAVASGAIRADPASGRVLTGFVSPWLRPFPFAIGLLTLAIFAFLAAVYLTLETRDPDLQEDFRRRALSAAVTVGVLAFASLVLSAAGAPLIHQGLTGRLWSIPFQALTGAAAVGAIAALWVRRYTAARALAIIQVTLILWGWGAAQFPHLVVPDLTFPGTAAPASVLRVLLVALAVGAALLMPSLWYLFRIFKSGSRDEVREPGAM
ncbi:MAG: cytochrome d ubiquinol oxidase subunit II [Gemmatimonadetes bacterium]|nr:cytochrome d ubiquinol oxidase subunit II [Gemmatimonadota bacterium]